MSNIAINKIISPQSSVGKTTTKNSSTNQSDFGSVLNEQIKADADFNKDGSFVLGKNVTIIKPDLKPVTAEELQEKFGITKADAEGMLKLPPVLSDEEEQKIMESSPAYCFLLYDS